MADVKIIKICHNGGCASLSSKNTSAPFGLKTNAEIRIPGLWGHQPGKSICEPLSRGENEGVFKLSVRAQGLNICLEKRC